MNNLRTYYEGYLLSNRMVNQNGLVVFVEASKGERWYFYFSNFSVVFVNTSKKIKKKKIKKKILEEISYFLQNIPLSPPYKNLIIRNKPNCIIKNNKIAYQ